MLACPCHVVFLVIYYGTSRNKSVCLLAHFRAEHFRFSPVMDQNKQPNQFFKKVFEPNKTENRFELINFGSVRFGFFPFQTGRFGSLLATQSLSRICTSQNRGLNPYQDLYKPKQGFDFNNPILIKPKQGFDFSNPILIKNLYINHGTTFYM